MYKRIKEKWRNKGARGGEKNRNKQSILYFYCLRTCQLLKLHLFLYLLRLRIFGHFRKGDKNWTCLSFRPPVHVLFKQTREATQMALHICDVRNEIRDAHPRTLHVPLFEAARHLEVAALITWKRRI